MQTSSTLPQSVRSVLWSYDLEKIDLTLHKRTIISQVLNFGTEEATKWLFKQYTKNEIAVEANNVPIGQWDKKSLALWVLLLDIHPISKAKKMSLA